MMTDRAGFIVTEPTDQRQYVTVGWMMQRTGLSFRTLRDAMNEIGMEPDFALNNIRYYSVAHSWPKLEDHLVNSGLVRQEMTLRVPAGRVTITPPEGQRQ